MEGGQPGTGEQALVARQGSPCQSSNSDCSLLCLVWKKLQEGRPSSLMVFSAPRVISLLPPAPLPKLAVSLPPQAGPGARHHTRSGTGAHRQPPTQLHPATRKVLANNAAVPQPRVRGWLGTQLKYTQPGSRGHFSSNPPDGSITHLQHPSLEKRLTLSPSP